MRFFLVFILVCVALAGAEAAEPSRRFDFNRDTIAFSNDTLWAYSIDAQGNLHMRQRDKTPEFTRHCFVMCRAIIQFYRFVRFDPSQPKLSAAEYTERVRHVCRIPVWYPPRERVVIPGYADLRSFSKDQLHPLEQELGSWWPSYIRFGNWRMAMPFPRIWQKKLAGEVTAKLDENKIQALFMTRFHPGNHLNHCVIVYGYQRLADGTLRFDIYDPNDAKAPKQFTFDPKSNSFYFARASYFAGGKVNVFEAYVAPWK